MWQQVVDKVTGPEQQSHLQPKQETEQVNEEWYVAFETSKSAPSISISPAWVCCQNFNKQLHQLDTKYSSIWAYRGHLSQIHMHRETLFEKENGDNLNSVFSGKKINGVLELLKS